MIQEIVERAVSASRSGGCFVIADEVTTVNTRWAGNRITTNGFTQSRRLTVIAVAGGSIGVLSSTGALESVEELVAAAERIARQLPPAGDDQPMIPGAGPGADWAASPDETSIDVFSALLPALGDAFATARSRQLYGYAEHQVRSTYLASSAGLRLRHVQPTGLVELTARDAGGTASTWNGVTTADFAGVDLSAMTAEAHTRLDWARNRVELPPGRYEVLLSPSCVADLMLQLYQSASGQDAADGRTVFSRPGGGTLIGERLSGQPLTLRSDPFAPGLECAPFTVARASNGSLSVMDNGLPLGPTKWISDGVLTALVSGRHSAGGGPVTPQIDNLILDGNGRSLAGMVADTENGLLINCLWYLREVDPRTLLLTGTTRDGVYLVRHGEVVGAVNNFRFNESPVGLLDRVVEVGRADRTLCREWSDYFTRMAMPPLRVDGFAMSAVSSAA